LRTVQKELGQIFDTSNFQVAFQEGDQIVYELEVEAGQVLPRRQRKSDNGLTEYILRTGQPLLIRSDMERALERLGVTLVPQGPAKSFCGAPILVNGKATGVMSATSTSREYVFEQRDLEVLKTAAGQVSVAIENARLFAEEQRLILKIFGSRERDHEGHLAILEALERRDAGLVVKRMRAHLKGVEDAILRWDPQHHPVG
jgi:GAF domain-containing protein